MYLLLLLPRIRIEYAIRWEAPLYFADPSYSHLTLPNLKMIMCDRHQERYKYEIGMILLRQ